MWLMFALQVAGPPAPVPPNRSSDRPCPVAQPGEEIVVCARRDDEYRLKPLTGRYDFDREPPKAEMAIAGVGKVAAEVEQGRDAQGAPINRAMIRLRIPLGGDKR
ncbi:hypothetical protein [Sphingomonas radiodurans]|uniref:hypothetical protein n=1 Tax=Sphingomonas radiodurans TaxID=2890321 RepID=UPI001E3A587C|nr:hypothetical protein [Sphingomonas radiodurans]WBH16390.1 hypothetical protein LLW23_16620 [Sphingomonas radiodurans]